jgi:sensor histidine kinase YesM
MAWVAFLAVQMPMTEPKEPETFWHVFSGLGYTLHIELLIYWAIVGATHAFAYYALYRERDLRASELEAQLANAQLQALRAQLQPHFLFNTLHGIAGLVRTQRNETAVEMIAGLSDLLRLALENAGRHEVPLGEEMEFVERYLALQRMRFSDRLDVELDVEPAALSALVPNLILQPLVENAIRHGVARSASAGRVEVHACRDEGMLRVEVLDDGPGPGAARPSGRGGLGLTNTRERLAKLYGDAFAFDVREREAGGTAAILRIPLREGAEGARP